MRLIIGAASVFVALMAAGMICAMSRQAFVMLVSWRLDVLELFRAALLASICPTLVVVCFVLLMCAVPSSRSVRDTVLLALQAALWDVLFWVMGGELYRLASELYHGGSEKHTVGSDYWTARFCISRGTFDSYLAERRLRGRLGYSDRLLYMKYLRRRLGNGLDELVDELMDEDW